MSRFLPQGMSISASRITTPCGAAAALLGGVVLAGWWLAVPVLKSVLPGHVSMKPNTALGFALAGAALVLLSGAPVSWRREIAGRALALLTVLIGALTLCEYVFGWRPGIDELLFKDDPNAAATPIPGRMAPSTAFNFLLLGLALLGIGWEPRRGFRPAEGLALLAGAVSLLSLLEYAVGQPVLYGFSEYTRMALHTTAAFVALSAGVLLARPTQGMVGALRTGRIGPWEKAGYAVLALLLLAVLAGGGRFYHAQERRAREEIEAEIETVARLKTDQIVQWRAERLGDAAVLTESPLFAEAVAAWMADPRADIEAGLLSRLRATQRHNQYGEILLVDAHGRVRMSLSLAAGELHADELHQLATAFAEQRPVLSDLRVAPRDRTPHANLMAPLFLATGPGRRPIGAVVLKIDPRRFLYPLIQSWPTASRTAEVLLVRREAGTVLYLNELRHRPGAALTLRIPVSRREVPAVRAALGEEGVVRGTDYRGAPVLSVLRTVPDSPWFLEAKIDEAEALAEWRMRARLIVAVIAALALALAGATGIVWQQRSRYRLLARSAEALHKSEALLDMTSRIGRIGGWELDLASKEVVWTAQTKLIHEVPPEYQPTLQGAIDFYAPEARPLIRDAVNEAIDKGTGWDLELPFITATNRRLWVRAAGHAECENGRAVRLFGTFQDITERRRAEEEIRALNADLERRVKERTHALEQANNELESFSYSVSHDLRAPLRHIQGFVELLVRDTANQLSAGSKRYLKIVSDAAVEMGRLIDDLLAFSRLGRAGMTSGRVPLDALVQDALRNLEAAASGRNIEWRIGPLPEVRGDASLLRQVFANLLDNAVKYSRPRDPARIEIGCSGEQDGCPVVFVRDNGVGFDMRYAHKLFGVFQRLHRADEFEGTGVGLALVRRIIGRHGGRVWAEAAPDRGATVYFSVPGASQGETTGLGAGTGKGAS